MKKRIIFFVAFVLLNCSLCTSVCGLESKFEESLFLPKDHWLSVKIKKSLQKKEYRNFFSTTIFVPDYENIITCRYGSDKASTDCRGNTLVHILLKPKTEETTYKDCEDRKGGCISLSIHFKKQQKDDLNQDDLDNLSFTSASNSASASYNASGQKEIDAKLDDLIKQNREYAWINERGVTRTLIATSDGSQPLGYLIEKEDGSKKVFWPIVHYCRLGIKQYNFEEWSTIKDFFDINNAQNPRFGTGWS